MSAAVGRLAETLSGLRNPREVEAFLRELLTPNEFHDLVLRWELVELLSAGVSQRQIASRLGVSLCKITRGAKILKKRGGVVAGILLPAKPPKAEKTKAASAKRTDKVQGRTGRGNGTRVAR